jgi:hypothetical protein
MPDGLKLFCLFAFPPSKLNYCGEKNVSSLIYDFLSGNVSLEPVIRNKISSFEMAFPYLKLLAERNNCSFLDQKIVEGYWIGNTSIDGVTAEELKEVYFSLAESNLLNRSVAFELTSKLPEKLSLHHSFHVFLFHSLSYRVKGTIDFMDSCRVSFGKVLEKKEDERKLLVDYFPLVAVNERLFLGEPIEKEISFFPEWDSCVFEEDLVAFHWNVFCTVLNKNQFNALENYTKKSIDFVNSIK